MDLILSESRLSICSKPFLNHRDHSGRAIFYTHGRIVNEVAFVRVINKAFKIIDELIDMHSQCIAFESTWVFEELF